MITLVGQIDGKHVKAAVFCFNEIASIEGPLWFTLDQWQRLREDQPDDSPIWATTPEEYKETTGEKVTP